MTDCLIIGGGVIGLSLAWRLALRGRSVRVLDRQGVGREASWAGAGILPPASRLALSHPLDQLRGWSFELHREWAATLREQTGIDTGYRRCGGLYLARSAGEAAALAAWAVALREEEVIVEPLSTEGARGRGGEGEREGIQNKASAEAPLSNVSPSPTLPLPHSPTLPLTPSKESLSNIEPEIVINPDNDAVPIRSAWLLPDECQLRNPRYLKGLTRACELLKIVITPDCEVLDFGLSGGRVESVITSQGVIRGDQVCVTSGAWTGQLLQKLGLTLGVVPIRGQMVMFRCDRPPVNRIINEGSRYLVPRDDGRLLVGSTEEEAGFDKQTTEEGIAGLIEFARSLLPVIKSAEIERTWAGLRPGSFDGFPYLGPIPGLSNAFVAAGHFRSGLYLSPATAMVMAELMCGAATSVDLSPFRVGR